MEYKFLQSMYLCKLLYGIEFNNEDDFTEIALNAWHIIGNKKTKVYRYTTSVDPVTLCVLLPCDADWIEAVVAPGEDWNESTNIHNDGDRESSITEQFIELYKREANDLYISGHFVHYRKIDDTLYFTYPYKTITILYRGVVLDEDGLPTINDKEMNAIATYVAYVKMFKDGLITRNQATIQLSQTLEKKWYFQCDLARTPNDPLSQNQIDEILDAKSRFVNKKYGKSFKIIMS